MTLLYLWLALRCRIALSIRWTIPPMVHLLNSFPSFGAVVLVRWLVGRLSIMFLLSASLSASLITSKTRLELPAVFSSSLFP
jgi:hypothetical protein